MRRVRDWLWEAPGAAAAWPAAYTAGVGALWALGAGASPEPRRVLAIGIGALGVFVLDRVKLLDRALDIRDATTDPDRYRWLLPVRAWWRVSAVIAIAVATLGLLGDSGAAAPVAFALLAVGYAGLTGGRGVKRLPWLKPVLVGAGLTGYAAWGMGGTRGLVGEGVGDATDGLLPLLALVAVVVSDAALCDLDEIDEREPGAWAPKLGAIGLVGVALGIELVALAAAHSTAWQGPRLWLFGLILTTPLALVWRRIGRVKDLVDARLALLAALAWLG